MKGKKGLKEKIRNGIVRSRMHDDEVATGTIYSLETGDEKVNMGMRHVGLQGGNKAVYAC